MDLTFQPLTLEAIDEARAESLCLFVAEDERPLTGLGGLVDWRLTGRLSRLLRGNLITGAPGEAVLTPPGARLGFDKMFLFGIGPLGQPEDALVAQLGEALRKLGAAGTREVALQLPARLSPDLGVRTLLAELHGPSKAIVFAPEPQKLIQVVNKVARGAAAPPERRVVKVPTPKPPGGIPRRAPPVPPAVPKFIPAEETAAPVAHPMEPLAPPEGEVRPAGPQRYVPPPPREDHVFSSKKKKR